jgi:hypothetical protein
MRIGGGVLLFLAIIFTISSAKGDNFCSGSGVPVTQKCKQDSCEAYASAAVTTVMKPLEPTASNRIRAGGIRRSTITLMLALTGQTTPATAAWWQ